MVVEQLHLHIQYERMSQEYVKIYRITATFHTSLLSNDMIFDFFRLPLINAHIVMCFLKHVNSVLCLTISRWNRF